VRPHPLGEDSHDPVTIQNQLLESARLVVADAEALEQAPELPGCAADAETYTQALGNVEVVIREWIETAQELGRTSRVGGAGSSGSARSSHAQGRRKRQRRVRIQARIQAEEPTAADVSHGRCTLRRSATPAPLYRSGVSINRTTKRTLR
jgi:hypothetical protein